MIVGGMLDSLLGMLRHTNVAACLGIPGVLRVLRVLWVAYTLYPSGAVAPKQPRPNAQMVSQLLDSR